jgi:GNAT superfamily N-acetyltransferase
VEIRCLEYADIPETVELARKFVAESAFSRFQFSPEKMAVNLSLAITHPHIAFCHVVEHDEKLVGALLGYISEFFFGSDLIASDSGWFILPEYRGSRSAVRLLKNFQAWAKANGAKEVAMGVSTDVNPEKTGALLQKLGYKHVGGNYKLAI